MAITFFVRKTGAIYQALVGLMAGWLAGWLASWSADEIHVDLEIFKIHYTFNQLTALL